MIECSTFNNCTFTIKTGYKEIDDYFFNKVEFKGTQRGLWRNSLSDKSREHSYVITSARALKYYEMFNWWFNKQTHTALPKDYQSEVKANFKDRIYWSTDVEISILGPECFHKSNVTFNIVLKEINWELEFKNKDTPIYIR